MERPGIVYIAVNRANGKAYVGQTRIRFQSRIGNHLSVAVTKNSNTPFHRALRKYGFTGFDFAVLEQCDIGCIDTRESEWIKLLGCKTPHGYNRTDGGQGATGCEYTDERREKIRQSQLGERNRMKNPVTAKKHGDAIRGPRHQLFGKFGADHPRFGKHHRLSEETKARQRVAFNRPEAIEKRRQDALRRKRNQNGTFIKGES